MTIAVSIMYPAGDGIQFDEDYFVTKHMALVNRVWGKHLLSSSLVRGISGGPDTPPAWSMIATLNVRDMETLQAMLADGDEVNADVPNYTNATPQVLIGEVVG